MSDLRFHAIELITRLVKAEMRDNPDTCISLSKYDPLSPTLQLNIAPHVGAPTSLISLSADFVPNTVVVEEITASSQEEAEAIAAGLVKEETTPVPVPVPTRKRRNRGKQNPSNLV